MNEATALWHIVFYATTRVYDESTDSVVDGVVAINSSELSLNEAVSMLNSEILEQLREDLEHRGWGNITIINAIPLSDGIP